MIIAVLGHSLEFCRTVDGLSSLERSCPARMAISGAGPYRTGSHSALRSDWHSQTVLMLRRSTLWPGDFELREIFEIEKVGCDGGQTVIHVVNIAITH